MFQHSVTDYCSKTCQAALLNCFATSAPGAPWTVPSCNSLMNGGLGISYFRKYIGCQCRVKESLPITPLNPPAVSQVLPSVKPTQSTIAPDIIEETYHTNTAIQIACHQSVLISTIHSSIQTEIDLLEQQSRNLPTYTIHVAL